MRKKDEVARMQEILASVPSPTEASGSQSYNVTMFKMAYVMFRETEQLGKLTCTLIVLTAILAALTIVLAALAALAVT